VYGTETYTVTGSAVTVTVAVTGKTVIVAISCEGRKVCDVRLGVPKDEGVGDAAEKSPGNLTRRPGALANGSGISPGKPARMPGAVADNVGAFRSPETP